LPWLLAGSALVALATPSRAATFDEQTGRLTLGDAAVSISFDDASSLPLELEPTLIRSTGATVPATELPDHFGRNPEGLEGLGFMGIGGSVSNLRLSLASLGPTLGGRRVEIRFWQQPAGTRLRGALSWFLTDAADPEHTLLLAMIMLQPTGRATDDGWEEWTTGPVDFAAGGLVPAAVLELEDVQVRQAERMLVTFDGALGVRLDALEILDLGPAAVPTATCTGLDAGEICGPEGACVLGQCVDAVLRYGQTPRDEAIRADYVDRLLFEFRTFEGGRLPLANLGVLAAAADEARADPNPARFWPAIQRGVGALQDGHAMTPLPTYGARQLLSNLGVCLHLGEADLLPSGEAAPLVFSVSSANPVAEQLAVGDVLVAIDGLPPYEWAAALGWPAYHSGDPRAWPVIAAPGLVGRALVTGAPLTFARCPQAGGVPTPCAAEDLVTIEIDLGALAGEPAWTGALPAWLTDSASCDHRFRRGVEAPDVTSYFFAGHADDGPVRTLLINGVPSLYDGGEAWWGSVQAALSPPPPYLILDQRTGSGGGIETTDFLMGLLLTEADFDRMEILPSFEQPLDDARWAQLDACYQQQGASCADSWRWSLHEYSQMEPALRGVAGGIRVAVLNAYDVSGNDYTSKLFTYRGAPTRIFGPGPTYGAFGPVNALAAYLDEVYGARMQHWDTIFVQRPDDPRVGFATGTGIDPDVRTLQRQSDALQGIDTTIAAARAWLLEE
jgi:hypothetical protein